jgi:selenocysteine lyase/cysteine desulfurase
VNPHSWIHLEITQDDGTKEVWMVEGGTPNVLQRRGLRRECLPIGTELIVDGYQAKDHSLTRANGRDVTFTDGTKFFLGSSGTGAPTDGAETRGRSNPARC